MKRVLLIIFAVLIMAIFTGCSKKGDAKDTGGNAENGGGTVANSGSPVPENAVDEKKSIYGEVIDIAGNSITVKEIEMPDTANLSFVRGDGEQPMMRDFSGEGGTAPENGATDGEGTWGEEMAGLRDAITVEEDGTFSFNTDSLTDEQREALQGMRESRTEREVAYTGEEYEIIIPVGLSLSTMEFGENGVVETEFKLNKLKTGDTVTITYAEDGKAIEKILVSQAGSFMNGFTLPEGFQGFDVMQGSDGEIRVTIPAGGNGNGMFFGPGGGN